MYNRPKKSYSERINNMLDGLPDYVSSYKESLIASNSKYSTIYNYIHDINYFLEWLIINHPHFCVLEKKEIKESDLAVLTFIDINRFISNYRELSEDLKRSDKTVSRKRATLSGFFGFLCSKKAILSNPVTASAKIKHDEKPIIFLEPDEQTKLLNTILHGTGLAGRALSEHEKYVLRDYALILLLLDSGLRVSEAQLTNIQDYDFDKNTVVVLRKGGKVETIYFSERASYAIQDYIESKPDYQNMAEEPLFTTLQGNRLSIRAIENLVQKYACAAVPQKGKKITPHKMRSTFAIDLYDARQNDILLVKERLGHKSILATQVYAKVRNQKIAESSNFRDDTN